MPFNNSHFQAQIGYKQHTSVRSYKYLYETYKYVYETT